MTKYPVRTTIFCVDDDHALSLSAEDKGSRALVNGPGSLYFHRLIAEHGAGEFQTLYVPQRLRGTFVPPAGIVKVAGFITNEEA